MNAMKDSQFDHTKIEAKWQGVWAKAKIDIVDVDHAKRPFYNLMMFPYPSAEGLHVGNMYAFTGSDIYGRFKRMQGNDVFEPIGLDGFGIHSENYALKIGRHPMDHAEITQKNFYNQLHKIGAMFDWTRTVETYDTDYYRWTQWLFSQMFKHGLAYRGKAEVNFCPSCKTVLADEQVIDEKCERCGNIVEKRLLEQWFFKITAYAEKLLENSFSLDWSEKVKIAQKNWIGKKEGVVIHHTVQDLNITLDAFSAYPAWLWADTFLVIAPDHPMVGELVKGSSHEKDVTAFVKKWQEKSKAKNSKTDNKEGVFTGRFAIDPFNKDAKMPIWIANFALMSFGTGIIRCSAHDPRDYEFAQKYKIPLKEVVKRVDSKSPVNAHDNEGTLEHSGQFSAKKISGRLINEIVDWIVNEKIGDRRTTYHLRDWLISRQRYWGPPIPMIQCKKCHDEGKGQRHDMPGWYSVPDDQLPVVLPRIEDYKPGDDGVAPLAKHKEFYETICPGCGGKAVRETDVSDTFLDSSWYFLRYPSVGINPKSKALNSKQIQNSNNQNSKSLGFRNSNLELPWDPEITRRWLPVHMYTGGAEHSVLHLMYSRFIAMALKDWGYIDFDEPFTKFYAHGLVIKDGTKMSKSRGNAVNPDEYIKLYGADSLRLYLMFMGPYDQGGDFRDSAMEGMSRWVGRVWRLVQESATGKTRSSAPVATGVQKLIKKVTDDVQKRRYNTAIASMMECTNLVGHEKWMIEKEDAKQLVLLLAPFAPHVAEELWEKLGGTFSVHKQPWPTFDATQITEASAVIVVQVNGKLRDTIQVDVTTKQDTIETQAKASENVKRHLVGKSIKNVIFVPGKLINFVL